MLIRGGAQSSNGCRGVCVESVEGSTLVSGGFNTLTYSHKCNRCPGSVVRGSWSQLLTLHLLLQILLLFIFILIVHVIQQFSLCNILIYKINFPKIPTGMADWPSIHQFWQNIGNHLFTRISGCALFQGALPTRLCICSIGSIMFYNFRRYC